MKKEVKRLEKKTQDLVAELKESLDMLKKFMWEAETSGGEDGVKEMVEEENEVFSINSQQNNDHFGYKLSFSKGRQRLRSSKDSNDINYIRDRINETKDNPPILLIKDSDFNSSENYKLKFTKNCPMIIPRIKLNDETIESSSPQGRFSFLNNKSNLDKNDSVLRIKPLPIAFVNPINQGKNKI